MWEGTTSLVIKDMQKKKKKKSTFFHLELVKIFCSDTYTQCRWGAVKGTPRKY